jgi:hypothetical protein
MDKDGLSTLPTYDGKGSKSHVETAFFGCDARGADEHGLSDKLTAPKRERCWNPLWVDQALSKDTLFVFFVQRTHQFIRKRHNKR